MNWADQHHLEGGRMSWADYVVIGIGTLWVATVIQIRREEGSWAGAFREVFSGVRWGRWPRDVHRVDAARWAVQAAFLGVWAWVLLSSSVF